MPKTLIEPFRIKSIEPIRMTSRSEREQLLERPTSTSSSCTPKTC
jgi:tryptophanase